MTTEVLYAPGYPNYPHTLERVKRVLASESGRPSPHVPVSTEAEADSPVNRFRSVNLCVRLLGVPTPP
jgi:hypothetical protein